MKESIRYDSIADRYDETRGGLVRGRAFAGDFARVIGPAGATVVDLGVATGAVALPLRDLGYDVVGFDLSLPMLKHAQSRLGPAVALGDALRLPVRDRAAGAITMSWLLQLVADQVAVFVECDRILDIGGRVAVVIATVVEREPCELRPIERALAERLGATDDARPAEAVEAAERAGFRLVDVRETEPQTFHATPADLAEQMRHRLYGELLGLSDDDFERLAGPAIEELLALPEPDRPRRRVHTHPLLIFER